MQSQYTLNELASELTRRQGAKEDYIADTTKINMLAGDGEQPRFELDFGGGVAAPEFELNDVAHNQVASRLGIPVKYYNAMRSTAPQLLADNVNHWLHNTPEKRMVRTLDNKVRAFLSDRYQRIENDEIANMVLPILLEQESIVIQSCAITESRMYIKAVFPKIAGEIVKGDVVQSGIVISNSEVGQGAVSIKPLVYRLVCSNGLILDDSKFTARHVGGRITAQDDNIRELLSDEAIRADDRAILLKVRDIVAASFDEARFAARVETMRESTQDKIQGNPVEAVKLLAKKLSFSEGESTNILRHLIEGADLSRYGLLNAVTRSAQDESDYDRATELETLGGNILVFPRKEWEQVAMAA